MFVTDYNICILIECEVIPRGGGGGLPLDVGPTKPKIWTHTDTKIVKKTSPLGYQTLKHAHMMPIEIPDTFP